MLQGENSITLTMHFAASTASAPEMWYNKINGGNGYALPMLREKSRFDLH